MLAAASSLVLAACDERQAAEQPAQPPPAVLVTRVERQAIAAGAEFIGRVEAIDKVDVRARVTGFLHGRHFAEGQELKAGDLLFTIDQRPFQARLAQAQADVNSSQAVVDFTQEDLKRAVALADRGNLSQQVLDQRRQEYRVAEANLAAPLTVRALAEAAHTSAGHLHQLCRRHLGRSPMAHVSELRLERAMDALARSTLPVAQIAQDCGYSDQTALTRALRRRHGVTPAAYRRGRR